MKHVLVTGSNGFIASHAIEILHDKGYEVMGFQRHVGSWPRKERYTPDTMFLGDLKDKEAVEKAVKMCPDGVLHLAGILGTQETINNPYPAVEVNILGGLNVLEACRIWGHKCVYIAVANYWMDNSYSITKTTLERFCRMYAKEHGVKVNVVRAFNAFGERQKAYPIRKMLPSFITRAINGLPLEVYGDGSQLMDFVYVQDVGHILIDVLENQEDYGQIFEAGTGIGYPVSQLAEWVVKEVGNKTKIEFLPMRPGETPGSKVISENPYPFNYTSFLEGLSKTVKWYKVHHDTL